MRNTMREADINRKALIHSIADFVQKILNMNKGTPSKRELPDFSQPPSKTVSHSIHITTTSPALPSTSRDIIYETPKSSLDTGEKGEEEDEDIDVGDVTETDVQQFGTRHFGELASPYVTPYIYNRMYLDRDFGILKDVDGQFRIGNYSIEIDEHSNVILQGKTYTGTKGLFELLTRKKVNHSLISTQDLRNYKRNLRITSGHLENNDPSGDIKIRGGTKFKEVISKLFPGTRRRGVETALRRTWIRYK
jgi:hypothetical protein